MTASRSFGQLAKSLSIIAAVGVITTGVTFAALQSPPATLANNTINIGAADLRISTNGSTFSVPSVAGFTFDGVVPGGAEVPVAGDTFYLKNFSSNTNLALNVAVSTTPSNLGNVNLAKVYLGFTRTDDNSQEIKIPLKTLMDANATGGVSLGEILVPQSTAQFNLKVSMDNDAYSGTGVGVNISGINLGFNGIGN